MGEGLVAPSMSVASLPQPTRPPSATMANPAANHRAVIMRRAVITRLASDVQHLTAPRSSA